jgi:flagellar basal body-associated protein FliL
MNYLKLSINFIVKWLLIALMLVAWCVIAIICIGAYLWYIITKHKKQVTPAKSPAKYLVAYEKQLDGNFKFTIKEKYGSRNELQTKSKAGS